VRYRFGFAITTAAGNQTRYLNLRRFAARDPEIECVWAPDAGEPAEAFAPLPAAWRRRLITVSRAGPVLRDGTTPATAYIEARRQMILARRDVADVFDTVDVLVTPTAMGPPARVDASPEDSPEEFSLIRNTVPFNSYGLPTISVPCGFTRAGLPIGLQITGPRLGEARVLALAHAYEQATDWHLREPPLR
jgi:Asp-tRNA(Asn)/Glu-tRNA(Gln) amidotransferase A subunit family amidase